ncbi:hypothetical protein CUJ84_pRLN2000390 (plasmid) [Rhizobium leguminosarum]|uniref:Uncharacterized protein n=1 Tax=Rhizobium leguminosarum TaxID=384 RepID=A0A2K9ZFE2_RHILE|nr:hypothetical protein CUJ84_pRLN2000390 [Rhizobium leguminosarum]
MGISPCPRQGLPSQPDGGPCRFRGSVPSPRGARSRPSPQPEFPLIVGALPWLIIGKRSLLTWSAQLAYMPLSHSPDTINPQNIAICHSNGYAIVM